MGKIRTATYRVEVRHRNQAIRSTHAGWPSRREYGGGKPSPMNLARWAHCFNASVKPDGINRMLYREWGDGAQIVFARIVRQATGEVVAEWYG